MVDLTRNDSLDDLDPNSRASFILRCWIDAQGKVHIRLIDVHSGVGYPLTHLSDLPGLLRRLLLRRLEPPDNAAPERAGPERR